MPNTSGAESHGRPTSAAGDGEPLEVSESDLAEAWADTVDDQSDMDLEALEADADDERQPVAEQEGRQPPTVPDEVNPADRAEQERDVTLDEDEYRP